MPSEDSSDFKKLIKEVGIRKAIEIMKERGISYSGDFTVDHMSDPIFSTPYISQKEIPKSIHTVVLEQYRDSRSQSFHFNSTTKVNFENITFCEPSPLMIQTFQIPTSSRKVAVDESNQIIASS